MPASGVPSSGIGPTEQGFGFAQAIGPTGPSFGFVQPMTTLEPRKIVDAKQRSSEFVLDDGTTLTIRPVLIDVKRATGQWGTNGKPLYVMALANVTDTNSPSKLMDPRFVSVKPKTKKRKKKRR